jgi:concentrative nucleoside transporter, CNT family
MQKPESLETPVEQSEAPPQVVFLPPTPLWWRLAILLVITAIGLAAYFTRDTIGLRGQAMAGLFFFFGIVAAFSSNLRAVNWRSIACGILLQLALAILVLADDWKYQLVAGICMLAIVYGWFSAHILPVLRGERVRWLGLIGGLIGVGIAYYVFYEKGVRPSFETAGDVVKAFITFSDKGAEFVFGNLSHPEHMSQAFGANYLFSFAFKALPPILFVSALFTVLYHFGILQWLVRMLAVVMVHLMGTSGAETLSVAANVFMGQTEAPLIVRPYVPRMTNSELFALMVSGMAHISGALMVVYISYGANPVAVLTTCVMACPCSLYLAKLFLPEVSRPVTAGTVHTEKEKSPYVNAIDAAATGTSDGLSLALNVAAMLIVFIAFVAMFDALLANIKPMLLAIRIPFLSLRIPPEYLASWPDNLSLQTLFGWLFSPVAFLMGIPTQDTAYIGGLLGTKLSVNEHMAFLQMQELIHGRHPITHEAIPVQISERSFKLAAFALTGFANFSSVGIQLGGIGAMAPKRRHDLARLGLRALFVGFTASLLNAAMAGLLNP